jgi:soluble lytic murein transglycosylase-like protein
MRIDEAGGARNSVSTRLAVPLAVAIAGACVLIGTLASPPVLAGLVAHGPALPAPPHWQQEALAAGGTPQPTKTVPAPMTAMPTPVIENPVQFSEQPPPAEHRRLVRMVVREAGRFRLDPRLVLAVMQIESRFDAQARSPRNAQGLMQLMPDTARRFQVQNVNDPLQNLRGGMRYLRWLIDYYHGDVVLALAAYNSGEGSVDRHRGVPPFRETVSYVQRIRALYPFDRHPYDAPKVVAPSREWVTASASLTSPVTSGVNELSQLQ